jgi:hypothetical protein
LLTLSVVYLLAFVPLQALVSVDNKADRFYTISVSRGAGADQFCPLDNRRIVIGLSYLAEIYERITEPFSRFLRLIEVWQSL